MLHVSVPLPVFALERKYKLWGFLPHQSWVQSSAHFPQEVTHTWYFRWRSVIILETWTCHNRRVTSSSAQKYATLLLQLSSVLLYLTNSSGHLWLYWHTKPPWDTESRFLSPHRLTQETALLDKSTFLNTPRIVKKKFSISLDIPHLQIYTWKILYHHFFHLITTSPSSASPNTTTVSLLWTSANIFMDFFNQSRAQKTLQNSCQNGYSE